MVEVVRLQQEACERAGSVLYGRILGAVVDDLLAGGPCRPILEPWSENALADAVPLRFVAAVHRIVLEGGAPDLAAHYPSAGGTDTGDPVPAFLAAVADHRERIADEMRLGVQTNEVGRAASLVGAFHLVSASYGLPLRILEVGASAGLLLRWDHYGYVGGGRRWGADEGVHFDEPWTTAPPPFDDRLVVAERAGCDIHPIDVGTDQGVTALRGFLWPDQTDRRARLDAAIEVARRHPATLEQADAGDWVAERLDAPTPGMATVVYHSIVLQYLPRPTFERLRSAIVAAGERATPEAPVCWLRMEPAGELADVRLRSWPGGEDETLAATGYHGPPVTWSRTGP
jgi:hypothetical protein